MGHQAIGSTCHTGIQCRAARVKHPSHGAGVVISNEASNLKAAPFPQLSWRDEVTMLKKEVGGMKQLVGVKTGGSRVGGPELCV